MTVIVKEPISDRSKEEAGHVMQVNDITNGIQGDNEYVNARIIGERNDC
jgi:hypothetical protein